MEIGASGEVNNFREKPTGDGKWINGGFFVLKNEVFNYLNDSLIDEVMWEETPLERLTTANELMAYKHTGFWQSMDTLRDKNMLEELWLEDSPPWKLW